MTTATKTTYQITLAPTAEQARQIAEGYYADAGVLVTVEAEYGDTVIEGTVATLAHRTGAWRSFPAPCNRTDITKVESEWGQVDLLVSHVDLDTVGGCFRVMLPADHVIFTAPGADRFWRAAEYIDLNGPHKVANLPEQQGQQLQAIWAWSLQNRSERVTEPKDVTADILAWLPILEKVIGLDAETIAAGQAWAASVEQVVEACFRPALSSDTIRVFTTDSVFCNAAYRNPVTGVFARACVVLNTKFGSVTVSALDNAFDCKAVVQGLWGPEAGGHPGIAGSPRGQVMTESDLIAAVQAVASTLV